MSNPGARVTRSQTKGSKLNEDSIVANRKRIRLSSDTELKSHFTNLPTELILKVVSFLQPEDFLRLTQTCKRFYDIINTAAGPWKVALQSYTDVPSSVLTEMASTLASKQVEESDKSTSEEKLSFVLHKKSEKNFSKGRFNKIVLTKEREKLIQELFLYLSVSIGIVNVRYYCMLFNGSKTTTNMTSSCVY